MSTALNAIEKYIFLSSIVEYLFPSVQHKYKKAAIGFIFRLIGFVCTQIISVHIWDYQCNYGFGCEQYNTIKSYMMPYKSIIQYFANCYLDIINYMIQASDTQIIKQRLDELENTLRTDINDLRTTVSSDINDLRTTVSDDHMHAITIPDDYIHEQPPSQRVVRPRIDIHEEFRRASHLHAE